MDLTIQVQVDAGEAKRKQLAFLESRSDIQVKVMAIGAGLQTEELEVGKIVGMSDVRSRLGEASPAAGSNDRRLILRMTIGAEELTEDPGVYTYVVPALSAPAKMEWWHLELPAGALWHDLADGIGLAGAVLATPTIPQQGSGGPIWQGGLGYAPDKNLRPRTSEPGNDPPPSLEMP